MSMQDPVSLVSSVPVLPAAAFKALELLDPDSKASFKDLEDAVKLDSALTARFLRVANSAMYARRGKVESLGTAISLLGFSMARNLVLLVATSSSFDPESSDPFFPGFWRATLRAAFYARYLADELSAKDQADRAFTAGILHYMGLVGLHRADGTALAGALAQAGEDLERLLALETQTFSTDHRAVGAALLASWGLPEPYVDVAAEYGSARVTSRHKRLILLFSLAEALARRSTLDPLPPECAELARAMDVDAARLPVLKETLEARLGLDPFAGECGLMLCAGTRLVSA